MNNKRIILCPNCKGNSTYHYLSTKSFRNVNIKNEFNLLFCKNCEIIFLAKDLSDSTNLYPNNYHCYSGINTHKKFHQFFLNFGLSNRIKLVTKHKKQGVMLDIGCATGEFLGKFSINEGWELYGIEPNNNARVYSENTYSIKTYPDIFEANFPDQFFDVITLWDVIEHIYTPNKLLSELQRISKINGLLIIKTPDPCSQEAKLFKSYWSGWESPWHLTLFPQKTLERLLKEHDFRDVKYYEPNIDYHTFYRSILNFFEVKKLVLFQRFLRLIFFKYPFKLFFNLFLRILRIIGFKSATTLISFRKK